MNIFYFLLVGLIAGWLAGQVMRGGGYGVIADVVLGVLGSIEVDGSSALWGFCRAGESSEPCQKVK